MILTIYFDGNGSKFEDKRSALYMKMGLSWSMKSKFTFHHLVAPVIEYSDNRQLNEDFSLLSDQFYENIVKLLKEINVDCYEKIILYGYSLGACVIAGLLYYMYRNNVELFKFDILTSNSDIFYPLTPDHMVTWMDANLKISWVENQFYWDYITKKNIIPGIKLELL